MIVFHEFEKIKTKNIIIQISQFISDKYSTKDIKYLSKNQELENFYIQTPYILLNYPPSCHDKKFTLDLSLRIIKNKETILNDYDKNIKEFYNIIKKIHRSLKARLIKEHKNSERDLFIDCIKEKKVINDCKYYNFKTKIHSLNEKPYIKIYNSNKQLCFEQKFKHNTLTRFILQLDSIWNFENTYGFNWYVVQAEIKLPNILQEYSFFNDTYKEVQDNIEPNPLYQKYFKMLKMGIPRNAVINKIKLDGLEPNFINSNLPNSKRTLPIPPSSPPPPPPPILNIKLKKVDDTKKNTINKEIAKPITDLRIPSASQLQEQLKKLKKLKK